MKTSKFKKGAIVILNGGREIKLLDSVVFEVLETPEEIRKRVRAEMRRMDTEQDDKLREAARQRESETLPF